MPTERELLSQCPNQACGYRYRIRHEQVGKIATCKSCGRRFKLAAGMGGAADGESEERATSAAVMQPSRDYTESTADKRVLTVCLSTFGVAVVALSVWLYTATRDQSEEVNAAPVTARIALDAEQPSPQAATEVPIKPIAKQVPKCVVLRDEVVADLPASAAIAIDVLIDTPLTKDQILALLREKLENAQIRPAFTYLDSADYVDVSAYISAEHQRTTAWHRLARMTWNSFYNEGKIDINFDESLHRQLFDSPEVLHGLDEPTRKKIFKEYVHANHSADDQAEYEFPSDSERVLKPGDRFTLTGTVMLMSHNNATEWLESGAGSLELPAGTSIYVIRTEENPQGTLYTQVAATLPNEANPYGGWVMSTMLGLQHPTISDPDVRSAQHSRRDQRFQELLERSVVDLMEYYGIDRDMVSRRFDPRDTKRSGRTKR